MVARKPGWAIKIGNRDLAKSSQPDAGDMQSAERRVERQAVTAGATPHMSIGEAYRPDAHAPFRSRCNNKKISGDNVQPLWGRKR